MHIRVLLTILLLATSFVSKDALAIPVLFDYTFADGSTVFGSLEGEIQSDGDTVLISAAYGLEYAGQTLDMSDFFVGYWSDIDLVPPLPIPVGTPGEGVISFSGDLMDFFACDLDICGLGVIFSNDPFLPIALASVPGGPLVTEFGFDADRWNLTLESTAVAEPNTLLLLLIGPACFFVAVFRRKTQPVVSN